jgi:16S rRNA C967 or C1407 C5-methylase (RsmB/RsmF family)
MTQPQVEWHADTRALLTQLLGEEAFTGAARALAIPPTTTCVRINTLRADPETAAAALRGVLNGSGDGGREDVVSAHPELPEALLIASGGVFEVDITPACGREVAVNRRCAEAVLRGAEVFVPGCLAISSGVEENQLVAVTAVIEPLDSACRMTLTRGTRLQPGQATASGRLLLGLGRTVLAPRTIFRAVDGLAVTMVSRIYRQRITGELLESTLGHGHAMLQNLPSVVAAHALAPRPGSSVLDMCASPGGKTSVLCALMGNVGSIVALDVNPKKVDLIRSLCREMGCTIVQAFQMDATKAVAKPPTPAGDAEITPQHDNGLAAGAPKIQRRRERKLAGAVLRGTHISAEHKRSVSKGPACGGDTVPSYSTSPFPPESFDFILCDAPCTALGLKPRLSQPVTAKELVATASYQRALLHTAVALLRPGGALVFSTCTISPLENESKCVAALLPLHSMRGTL